MRLRRLGDAPSPPPKWNMFCSLSLSGLEFATLRRFATQFAYEGYMNRRSFLEAMLACGMAPAVCRARWLMKGTGVIVASGNRIVLPWGEPPEIYATMLSIPAAVRCAVRLEYGR